MKIEIELEYVESLKKELDAFKKANEDLRTELSKFDKEKVEGEIKNLADAMFRSVIKEVFSKLGFEDLSDLRSMNFPTIEHWLGKYWWFSEKLDVTIGAQITNKFKGAFLALGVKAEEKPE